MRKSGLVLLTLICLAGTVTPRLTAESPQSSEPLKPVPPVANPEFPSFDSFLWMRQRGGLVAKLAAERLAQTPEDPETIALLTEHRRIDDALRVLRAIVEQHPDRTARAFEIVSTQSHRFFEDAARGYAGALRDIIAATRTRLPQLPRDQAAAIALRLVSVEATLVRERQVAYFEGVTAFVQEYAGTDEAMQAEVTLAQYGPTGQWKPGPTRMEALDTFVRNHPGTIAAAKALYQKAFDIAANPTSVGPSNEGDPTPRFLRVLDMAKELESGAYPPCEWVEKAPSLVSNFHAYRPRYAPGSVDRMIDAYTAYVKAHFKLGAAAPLDASMTDILLGQMPALFARQGDLVAGMERVLGEFEREATSPTAAAAIRYLRATFYLTGPGPLEKPPTQAERAAQLVKARELLIALSAEATDARTSTAAAAATADNPYPRRALASLASLYFYQRDYANARDRYKQYVERYPRGDWAWVAALRLGQTYEELGDAAAAATAYRAAAAQYAHVPIARALGYAYAARTSEGLGQFDRALADDRRALDAWDDNYGAIYSIRTMQAPRSESAAAAFIPLQTKDTTEIRKQDLPVRIAQLTRALDVPGGTLLERGRWLVAKERWQDARAPLEELIARYPKSPAVSDARAVLHRARFEYALELANVDNPKTDEAAAMRELDALASDGEREAGSREPNDVAVCAARVAKAVLLKKQGDAAQAQTVMTDALNAWRKQSAPMSTSASTASPQTPTAAAAAALIRDVVEIHRVVFLPTGGPLYDIKDDQWNAFGFPQSPPPFVIVNPDVTVKLPDGTTTHVSIRGAASAADAGNVLFFNAEQLARFEQMLNKLGGTKTRAPRAVMETPNQPIGPSLDILGFWNGFFAARQGHWGGWVLETYPIVTQMEFLNPERTKAAAKVTIGYSGATVVLEKVDGVWKAKGLVDRWIT